MKRLMIGLLAVLPLVAPDVLAMLTVDRMTVSEDSHILASAYRQLANDEKAGNSTGMKLDRKAIAQERQVLNRDIAALRQEQSGRKRA